MLNLLCIICTTAGKQGTTSTLLRQYAKETDISVDIIKVVSPTDIPKKIKKVNIISYAAVAVYGGDGTVIQAIKTFSNTSVSLLILPGGTANVLGKYYGLPQDLKACFELFASQTYITERADLAGVHNDPFVLDMHTGLWTEAITSTSRKMKKRIGEAAYGLQAIRNIKDTKYRKYIFSINKKVPESIKAYTMIIANQGNHNILGVPLFPYDHAPGMVQIAFLKDLRVRKIFLWYIWKKITGRHLKAVIVVRRAHEIEILKAPKKILIDDAEYKFSGPMTVSGGQFSIRLILPPETSNRPLHKIWYHKLGQYYHLLSQRIKTMYFGYAPSLKYSHVAPNIYLGGKYPRSAYGIFEEWGITGIISMRKSESPPAPEGIKILRLPTKDWTPPLISDFRKGVQFIDNHVKQDGAVYIHCQLGEGRGPSMAAAYLIYKGFTVDEAVKQLTRYRPFVRPNDKQLKRLAEWQHKLGK